jgi:hypothetical protein
LSARHHPGHLRVRSLDRRPARTAVPHAENLVEKLTQQRQKIRNMSGETREKLMVFTSDRGSKGADRAPAAATEGGQFFG